MLPDAGLSPFTRLFPNILAIADTPHAITALLVIAVIASALFCIGVADRLCAVLLWYMLACLFGRNPLISNPSLPFVGWMLLAHAGMLATKDGREWRFDPRIYAAAWIVMALAYSYSGYTKLMSPSWVDGSALQYVLHNPLARSYWLTHFLVSLGPRVLQLLTWGGLALELSFAPLACIPRFRPWIWGAMVSMHIGLLLTVSFAELSIAMLLLHTFTADPAWFGKVQWRRSAATV
jgi:hypothetical protein